ncbi:GntR family transcriptional regulator [Pimelobacter simplex]|uniref:GntR family transcriptional regulator n=1 Tax=Nocardioides simplex TaxID=2045 RepID=UPI00214F97B4|nr:GntR family transcriptional regulator [Pimelobacter simplex]UUW92029.1 GntR family transcriptional regulator [Pimelobacter simplex]UUW95856.1 GntR family transcriptional regulator [Pimelobacter simplex]
MAVTPGEETLGSRYRSLRDLVLEELRDQIIERRLAPGERLVERDLAEVLDVSRIVVREAIQQLAAEGMVTVLPRRGAQVAALDPDSALHLFEVRIGLESMAATAAAERRTDADLARLDRLIVEAQEATRAGDRKRATHLNMEFHEAVVDAAGNPLLGSIFRSLSGRALQLFRIGQDVDAHGLHHEHVELVAVLRAGDAERAGAMMAEHIAGSREGTIERVRQLVAEAEAREARG